MKDNKQEWINSGFVKLKFDTPDNSSPEYFYLPVYQTPENKSPFFDNNDETPFDVEKTVSYSPHDKESVENFVKEIL